MKKLNKKAVALTGLGAVVLVGGTLAYYNQTVSLDNPLHTGNYNNEMVEDFTPETDVFKPGATIDKIVGAKNTGDYPVMVRIRMDEKWQRAVKDAEGNVTDVKVIKEFGSKQGNGEHGDKFVSYFDATADYEENGKLVEYVSKNQQDVNDGKVEEDWGSVVRKNLTPNSNWIFNEKDGYWYFNQVLIPNTETGALLDSITLASNIDLGKYVTKDWYYIGTDKPDSDSTDWIEYTVERTNKNGIDVVEGITLGKDADAVTIEDQNDDGVIDAIDMAAYLKKKEELAGDDKLFRKNESLLDGENFGYADANYTLTVTSQFVQATPAALVEAFGAKEEGSEEMTIDNLPEDIQKVIEDLEADILGSESSEEPSNPENPENPDDGQ